MLKKDLKKDISVTVFLFRRLFFNRIARLFFLFIFVFAIFPIILFFIIRPKIQANINYGVNFSDKYATDLGLDWKTSYIEILDGLNVKNIRLVVYWNDVEKVNDEFDFSNIKWQLDEAEKKNLNVILATGRKAPRYPECHEPLWWRESADKKLKEIELYEFIKKSIQELKSYNSIKIWQVENEPFFPFGECEKSESRVIQDEVEIVRSLDARPILIQDSGEGGFWFPSYEMADYLGISMYRKIWYDFWKIFFGRFIYFQYPLAHWSYKIKADLFNVPYQNIIVTELQSEPWGPSINSKLSQIEKDKTMSRIDFLETINYAQKAGFKDIYFWGVEWWLWEKNFNNNSYFWDTGKALLN